MRFSDITTAQRKSRNVMQRLHDDRKVYRWRTKNGYCYSYTDPPNKSTSHTVATNWVRLWFEWCYSTFEPNKYYTELYRFIYEKPEYKHPLITNGLRPDALVLMKNKWMSFKEENGKVLETPFRLYFVETDLTPNNLFDKIPKYYELHEKVSKGEINDWWVKLSVGFPDVLIVTTTESRKKGIEEKIQHEAEGKGYHRPEIVVGLLDDIKAMVTNYRKGVSLCVK